ncbi:MAG: ABC transporter ATP-binding protein [Candidatus Aminicenantes bacterium]|nr:ABC transporter ATP-binding protein [Candidatus Aminicenantes bacterium]
MVEETTSLEVLRVENLYKSYKSGFIPRRFPVLKGISFSVHQGEIFGYLGPNGAGKTTTLKCILGLIFPDSGEIKLFGQPHLFLKAKEKVGYLPENPYFYEYLTAREFLNFYAQLFPRERMADKNKINELLHLVGLEKAADLQLRKFSKGMLQRIGLAQALINDPELVFLDEPLGGLDPIGRKELRDIIVNLKEKGKTVFLCSHILQDIEMICDRVAIIVGGRLVAQGALTDLISEKVLFTEITLSGLPRETLEGLGEFVSVRGDRALIKVFDENKLSQILNLVREKKGKIYSLVPRTETLEDIFVDMVKQR